MALWKTPSFDILPWKESTDVNEYSSESNSTSILTRLLQISAVLCVLLVFFNIFYWKPFFGLMDDHQNILFIERLAKESFFSFWYSYVKGDVTSYGMFRPTNPLLIKNFYQPAGREPMIFFLQNAVYICGVFAVLAASLARVFRLAPMRELFGRTYSIGEFSLVAFLTFFALPFDHYLFFHPSLQEKLIFLSAAIGFWLFASEWMANLRPVAWYALATVLVSTGFFHKSQFAVIVPGFAVIQAYWDHRQGRRYFVRTLYIAFLLVAWVAFSKWLGSRGHYTAGFGLHHVERNLLEAWSIRLFLVMAASSVLALGAGLRKGWVFWIPFLLSGVYLGIFLQWGISGYLVLAAAPGVVFFVVLALYRLDGLFPKLRIRPLGLALICFMALLVTFKKEGDYLSRYADIRRIIYSDEVAKIHSENGVILMPCYEAASAMGYFFRSFRGLDLTVVYAMDESEVRAKYPDRPFYWIAGDPEFCNSPNEGKTLVLGSWKPFGLKILKN